MSNIKQALESAIEALNDALTRFDTFNEKQIDAIQECYDALAEMEKCEPVAWSCAGEAYSHKAEADAMEIELGYKVFPLYTAPQAMAWVSVEDRLPECKHEDTSNEVMVSNSVMIAGICIDGSDGIGIGHYQLNGYWVCYENEHDYFNIEAVSHWMPLPNAPKLNEVKP